ncbi:hypothetical protein [Nonomuraea glycinis]|uniref:hypothetical protein n=1 Tax=Nonomuraea glycinis TaxID=2047744 RepID=UPI0033A116E6
MQDTPDTCEPLHWNRHEELAAKRPPVPRLLVSDKTAATAENARIQIAVATGREWLKTSIHDAIIAVGLAHMDEVMAMLHAAETEDGV